MDFQYTLPFSNKAVMNYMAKPPSKKNVPIFHQCFGKMKQNFVGIIGIMS